MKEQEKMNQTPGAPTPPPEKSENELNNAPPPGEKTSPRSACWTPERRAAQAERARARKPWEKSTGPRTLAGKRASRENAYKTGFHDASMRELRRVLKLQRIYLRSLAIPTGIYPPLR